MSVTNFRFTRSEPDHEISTWKSTWIWQNLIWNIHRGYSLPRASKIEVYTHLHKENRRFREAAKTVSLCLGNALANQDHVIGSRDSVYLKNPAGSILFNGTKIFEIRQEMMEKSTKVIWGGVRCHLTPLVSLTPVRVL